MSCLSILSLFLITLAISEVCCQECNQSSLVAPDNGGFLFSSDNSTAQLICKAGFHPENNEYTTLQCSGGEWVGTTPANCVPYKCKKCVLEWTKYWPENGKFEFSPDTGSELVEHLTEATVVCNENFYPARQMENTNDTNYYTKFEDETLRCHYGHWVGERKTKCIPKPAKQDMHQIYYKLKKDYAFVTLSEYEAVAATTNVHKGGFMFALLGIDSSECPEKVPLYRVYWPANTDHMFTTDEDYKNAVVAGGTWILEGVSGACVQVKGQCGMTNELHSFYHASLKAHILRRDLSYLANWVHNGIICYIH